MLFWVRKPVANWTQNNAIYWFCNRSTCILDYVRWCSEFLGRDFALTRPLLNTGLTSMRSFRTWLNRMCRNVGNPKKLPYRSHMQPNNIKWINKIYVLIQFSENLFVCFEFQCWLFPFDSSINICISFINRFSHCCTLFFEDTPRLGNNAWPFCSLAFGVAVSLKRTTHFLYNWSTSWPHVINCWLNFV